MEISKKILAMKLSFDPVFLEYVKRLEKQYRLSEPEEFERRFKKMEDEAPTTNAITIM
jgi:hypothetical protein